MPINSIANQFAGEDSRRRARAVVLGAVLVLAVFIAHSPAIFAGFVWDDEDFLTGNPLIKAPDGLYRFWFTTEPSGYFPLTSTMLWLEWRVWGDHPMPYHLVNILLHAAGTVLLWRVLKRLQLQGPVPFLAAMLFGIHPVTVASVAWIAERKNVLTMVLELLSVLAWLRFDEQGGRRWYLLALLTGTAALLAKTSVIMLPFALLLLIWWRRGRFAPRDVLRVLPFFLISLALGLVTLWFHRHNAIGDWVVRPEGLASKVAACGWVVWFYLYKVLLPVRLMMIYPRWNVDGGSWVSFIPLGLLIASFAVFWICRRGWGRGPLATLGWFVLMLAPVLGLADMSFMRYSLVSDHLQYAAMPGVIVLAAGLFATLLSRSLRPHKRVGSAAVVAGLVGVGLVLAALTRRQAQAYMDNESLWTRTIRLNNRAWIAYANRGLVYTERGEFNQAIEDLTRAVELKPDYANAYNNRGYAHSRAHDLARAMADFAKALELDPNLAEAYNNRGMCCALMNNLEQAIADFSRAITHNPQYTLAYANRASAWSQKGQYEQAVADLSMAIQLNPRFADAYNNRGATYFLLKAYALAWADVHACRQVGGEPSPQLIRDLTLATGH